LEIKETSAGQHIQIGEITLIPIIQTTVKCQNVNSSILCSGSKNAIGIIIVSPDEKRAINTAGEDVPVTKYLEQVPKLRELKLLHGIL